MLKKIVEILLMGLFRRKFELSIKNCIKKSTVRRNFLFYIPTQLCFIYQFPPICLIEKKIFFSMIFSKPNCRNEDKKMPKSFQKLPILDRAAHYRGVVFYISQKYHGICRVNVPEAIIHQFEIKFQLSLLFKEYNQCSITSPTEINFCPFKFKRCRIMKPLLKNHPYESFTLYL